MTIGTSYSSHGIATPFTFDATFTFATCRTCQVSTMMLNASSYPKVLSHTKYDAYHIGAPHWFHKGEAYPCIFIKCVCVCVSNQRLLVTIHEEFFILKSM
jgi:hypothetical protein